LLLGGQTLVVAMLDTSGAHISISFSFKHSLMVDIFMSL